MTAAAPRGSAAAGSRTPTAHWGRARPRSLARSLRSFDRLLGESLWTSHGGGAGRRRRAPATPSLPPSIRRLVLRRTQSSSDLVSASFLPFVRRSVGRSFCPRHLPSLSSFPSVDDGSLFTLLPSFLLSVPSPPPPPPSACFLHSCCITLHAARESWKFAERTNERI